MTVINLGEFKNRKSVDSEKEETKPWSLTSFDEDIPEEDLASLVGVLRESAEIFVMTDVENMRGVKLTPKQARTWGNEMLKLAAIADLVFHDDEGLLDFLTAPEEVE